MQRRAARDGADFDQPRVEFSSFDARKGQLVLRNQHRELARFNVNHAGRLRYVEHDDEGGAPTLAPVVKRIEWQTGMPFEQWIRRATESAFNILVTPQPGEAVEMKLVDFTGGIFGRWSFDREVYEALTKACATSGQSLLEFVVEAVFEKCNRVNSERNATANQPAVVPRGKPAPYHPPGERVKVLFYSFAQDDEPLADFDLEPAEYARLTRAARKARCNISGFLRLAIAHQLPQLEAAIAGVAR